MTQPVGQLTEQETFWSSDFGDEHIDRNQGEKLLASNPNFLTTRWPLARRRRPVSSSVPISG